MNAEDRAIIRKFAAGDHTQRIGAIAAYRREIECVQLVHFRAGIPFPENFPRHTPECAFMSEVDHPVPDYVMRDLYRKELFALVVKEEANEE